jgi:leucyl aminopeptidase
MKITLAKPGKKADENDLVIALTFKLKQDESKERTKNTVKTSAVKISKNIKELDEKLNSLFLFSAEDEGFLGDEGQEFVTNTLGKIKAKSIALLGLGDAHQQTADAFRKAAAMAFKLAFRKRAKNVGILVPDKVSLPWFDIVAALAEGLHLSNYQFGRYRRHDEKTHAINGIEIFLPSHAIQDQKTALLRAEAISAGVCLARDLINEGPMELNPEKFAKEAHKIAQDCGLTIEILDEKRLKKEKMNLMLGVAQASLSAIPPRLIKLHYKPPKPSKHKIALIGKGVTFDSGGLDLKSSEGMLEMKTDMSGAACVLGTMYAIAKIQAKVEVIGYMACVENGIGPHSYHPGDIIISRKGITVEIANTDAEGRLVLADTMTYAIDNDHPDTIIDVATLTGSIVIALGQKMAGIFSNDDALCEAIIQSGKMAGESFWRMPLTPGLKEIIKSPLADIKNCGDRYGGSITAALFLQEFIAEDIKWAHLDIAGCANNHKPYGYIPSGGVGFGVRTLVDYLMGH